MKICDNIVMLDIKGVQDGIFPVLAWDDKDVVLIDTGFPGQISLIEAELSKEGFLPCDITKVILTHHDIDHIGSAQKLQLLGAQILAHEQEVPYLQGEKASQKMQKLESRMDELSAGERAFYESMKAGAAYFYVKVDKVLHDGEELPFCGGIEVIHTPGHTDGHISLVFKSQGVLVAGDAANIVNGVLCGAAPEHSNNMDEAAESFAKLKSIGAESYICYHSGLLKTSGGQEAVEDGK